MAQILNRPAPSLPAPLAPLLVALLGAMLTLGGCAKPAVISGGRVPVKISGKAFDLEIVADDQTRMVGLGGRTSLDADKGMLFSFPDSRLRNFVMRDCSIPIDIIFLDSAGRIVAMHHMPVEEAQREGESDFQYEVRLKKYPSRFSAQYAIELAGGALEELDLEEGQHIELDTDALQAMTQ